jgi:protein TonB
MAYLDHTADPRRRTTAITAVIAIHALIAYVLVTGLVQRFTGHERDDLVSFFRPAPPPPPTPQPKQSEAPRLHEEQTAPKRQVDLTKTEDAVPETKKDSEIVDITPTPTATYTPSNPPRGLGVKPKAAAPRGAPARWVTTDDYPSRDLREGNEGVAAFRVVVGSNGRVSACEIVRSSGHPGLDAATCKAVTARARFEAATGANGEKVVGTYSNSVRWQIPR